MLMVAHKHMVHTSDDAHLQQDAIELGTGSQSLGRNSWFPGPLGLAARCMPSARAILLDPRCLLQQWDIKVEDSFLSSLKTLLISNTGTQKLIKKSTWATAKHESQFMPVIDKWDYVTLKAFVWHIIKHNKQTNHKPVTRVMRNPTEWEKEHLCQLYIRQSINV